ncbi:MAG TPA: phosphoenolpyruvate-utilizing N-terminal domain-containing protein, partial [Ktedonobacterales bacterium]|nr:phosphoenolpyruvate-utilizing N-terminal domain-containing protein [Ktedonobacterales bacterium]
MAEEQRSAGGAAPSRALQGLGVSAGQAIAPALLFRRGAVRGDQRAAGEPAPADPQVERQRLDAALERAASGLRTLASQVARDVGVNEAGIFEAQALMLEDPTLAERAGALIGTAGQTGAQALAQAAAEQAATLEQLPDPLWQARAADVRDAAGRAIALLAPEPAANT